jgi:hypothetical protein
MATFYHTTLSFFFFYLHKRETYVQDWLGYIGVLAWGVQRK